MSLIEGREFEFQSGRWNVKHKRLITRLEGAQDWQKFDGHLHAYSLLDGSGNVEDNFINFPGGAYRAVALRSFDSQLRQWAIWWLDGRNPLQLDVPVIGSFENGVGRFYSDDVFEGKPIKVCFQWSDLESETPCWQQAFSADGGSSWEINWYMEFQKD